MGQDDTTLAQRVMEWSRPVIAVFGMGLLAAAFVIAARLKELSTLNMLIGGVLALVSSISSFYFGSSSGSEKKDEMQMRQSMRPTAAPGLPAPQVVVPAQPVTAAIVPPKGESAP